MGDATQSDRGRAAEALGRLAVLLVGALLLGAPSAVGAQVVYTTQSIETNDPSIVDYGVAQCGDRGTITADFQEAGFLVSGIGQAVRGPAGLHQWTTLGRTGDDLFGTGDPITLGGQAGHFLAAADTGVVHFLGFGLAGGTQSVLGRFEPPGSVPAATVVAATGQLSPTGHAYKRLPGVLDASEEYVARGSNVLFAATVDAQDLLFGDAPALFLGDAGGVTTIFLGGAATPAGFSPVRSLTTPTFDENEQGRQLCFVAEGPGGYAALGCCQEGGGCSPVLDTSPAPPGTDQVTAVTAYVPLGKDRFVVGVEQVEAGTGNPVTSLVYVENAQPTLVTRVPRAFAGQPEIEWQAVGPWGGEPASILVYDRFAALGPTAALYEFNGGASGFTASSVVGLGDDRGGNPIVSVDAFGLVPGGTTWHAVTADDGSFFGEGLLEVCASPCAKILGTGDLLPGLATPIQRFFFSQLQQIARRRGIGSGRTGHASRQGDFCAHTDAGGQEALVVSTPADSDGDGVRDDVEDRAPNNGDGNNDGIPDRNQDQVASFLGACGILTLVTPEGRIELPESVWAVAAYGGTFDVSDHGAIYFGLSGVTPGAVIAVELLLGGVPAAKQFPDALIKRVAEPLAHLFGRPPFVDAVFSFSPRLGTGAVLDPTTDTITIHVRDRTSIDPGREQADKLTTGDLDPRPGYVFDPLLLGVRVATIDTDVDGNDDFLDNCIESRNGVTLPDAGGNSQLDTDGDEIGNVCDCDFDNDGFCSIADFNLFLPDFIASTDGGAGTDMDGDGAVGIADFNLFLPGFIAGRSGPSARFP